MQVFSPDTVKCLGVVKEGQDGLLWLGSSFGCFMQGVVIFCDLLDMIGGGCVCCASISTEEDVD